MKKLCCFILGVLLITACGSDQNDSEEPEFPVNEEGMVQFEGILNPVSRATDTQFDVNDEIGVFGVLSSGDDNKGVISSAGNYANNVKYFYDGAKFTSADGIDVPTDGKKVYYHAVYPYCANAAADFEFAVKTDQLSSKGYTQSDLCTANTVATDEKLVPLKFSHRLSRLIVTLKGVNWPTGDMKLELGNVYTMAKVNLNGLEFEATGSKGTITCASNGTNSFKAILPPQTLSKDLEIATLTIGNDVYTITLNEEYQLRSGVELSLSVTFNSDREIVEFEGDINPWEDGETELQRPEDVVKNGLYAYYTFENNTTDLMGNVDGTLADVTYVENDYNGTQALNFKAGDTSCLQVLDGLVDQRKMSISFWAKGLSDGHIFHVVKENNDVAFTLRMENNALKFIVTSYDNIYNVSGVNAFTHGDLFTDWHMITLVSDFGESTYGMATTKLYIDGKYVDVVTEKINPLDENQGSNKNYEEGMKFRMGGKMVCYNKETNAISMNIDNLRVYKSRKLSDAEVLEIYNAEKK